MIKERKRIFRQTSSRYQSQKYEFKVAWGAVPHPDKAHKGGQDAVFASKNILAVADGVSGWSKMGVDSGIYSRKLLTYIKDLIEGQHYLYYIEHPDELALKAVQMTEERGSSTLTLLTLHPHTGTLRSFHVGDSVFGIFHRNGSHMIAEEQQKEFDMPYQVYGGKINIIEPSSRGSMRPSDVVNGVYNQFSAFQVENSSIVVASDGLWDNVHIKQIHQVLVDEGNLPQKAKLLLQRSMSYCMLSQYASPYYYKGLAKGLEVEKLGKIDDVSIILAEIITVTP